MNRINNYIINKKIYESPRSIIYTAKSDIDDYVVVIKQLRKEHPSLFELSKFVSEYEIIKEHSFDGIIDILRVEDYNRTKILVMPYFEGESLNNILLGITYVVSLCTTNLPFFS